MKEGRNDRVEVSPGSSVSRVPPQTGKEARARPIHRRLRDAQLVLAREYGFAGWQDLTAEVSTRLGKGFEWAASQARRAHS